MGHFIAFICVCARPYTEAGAFFRDPHGRHPGRELSLFALQKSAKRPVKLTPKRDEKKLFIFIPSMKDSKESWLVSQNEFIHIYARVYARINFVEQYAACYKIHITRQISRIHGAFGTRASRARDPYFRALSLPPSGCSFGRSERRNAHAVPHRGAHAAAYTALVVAS